MGDIKSEKQNALIASNQFAPYDERPDSRIFLDYLAQYHLAHHKGNGYDTEIAALVKALEM